MAYPEISIDGIPDYPEGSDAQTFAEEVTGAIFTPEHYHGYGMYEGPAVRVDDEDELVEVIRMTSMPVSWDTLGMGYIVYPKRGSKGISNG